MRNELLGANCVHTFHIFILFDTQPKAHISLSYWLHILQSEFLKSPGPGLILSPGLVLSDE